MNLQRFILTSLLMVFLSLSNQAFSQYFVDFEGAGETKTSYGSGTVNLSGLDWDMTDILIGDLAADWKNGTKSARLRGYGSSIMSMLEDKEGGIGTISFYYRRYGTDAQVDWKVEYSSDGGVNWIQVGEVFTSPASDEVQFFEETINIEGAARIRIKRETESGTANRRLNIDDITLSDFMAGGNIPPVISNIVQIPAEDITSTTTVKVQANITDADGTITSATVNWGTQSGVYPNQISMQLQNGDSYVTSNDISAQADGTTVFYRISATDNDGAVSNSSEQSYIVKDPLTSTLPYSETFDDNLNNVYLFTVSGSKPWYFYNNSATANAHQGDFPEEHWLILPGINLDNYNQEVLSFTTYAQYGTYDEENYLKLFYSTDYAGLGDIGLAAWTEVAFEKPEVSTTEQSAHSGNIDISHIIGSNVYFAFKYYSNGNPTRWRVDDIFIYEDIVNPATHLAFVNFPSTGETGNPLTTFTVEARRADESVDFNFTGEISLSMAMGARSLGGTLTQTAIAGIATFSDIVFNNEGSYQLEATSVGLTGAQSSFIEITNSPTATEVLLPLYIANGANGNRIPYAFRAKLDYLVPNATYKYTNQVVDVGDGPTTNGAGNVIYVNEDRTITRQTANPSFTVPGSYGEFTTDANGSFIGWFMVEPTNNARFAAGNEVFMRIRLNDGAEGTAIHSRLTLNNPVQVISFGTEAVPNDGTGIVGRTGFNPNNMVMLFDNENGENRPLYGSQVESTGIEFIGTTWADFYKNEVAGMNGAWGGIVPNINANGVRLVQEIALADGNIVTSISSEDGIWGETNTVNPSGGKDDILMILLDQSPQIAVNPQQLSGFGYVFGQGPSEAQAFSVEGSFLNADILITAPQNFEISLSEQSGFTAQLVLPQDDGIVEPSQVFVRLKEGLDVGEYEQVITVSTEGAQSLEIALSGSVIEDFFHPESHVTAFAAEATDHQSIKLTWIDASPQADAYLIKGSSIGFEDIQNPQDGIVEDNDLLVQNVAAGVENHTFNALETNTSYFFKIFPYNQSQSDILYKTDGELPQATATTLAEPQMNTELLPLYFGANNNRLPYAFRASFSGLQANTTYKYINQVVDENDGPTTNGAGVPIFVAEDGSFNRSSSTSFANPAQHGQFTTNEEGAFSGWFMIEPTTNARFAAGKTVFMRIRLNDGMDGNAVAWIFTSEAVQMLAFGTEADENMGTALRGSSSFQSGNFVFLYGADERPLAGSSVEITGVDYAAVNAYAAFYKNDVSGVEGAWGTIVPNVNNDGIQRIEHRSNADGQLIEALVSEDGQWYQTNTVNPNGGLTEVLLIELDQSPQIAVNPQQLSGFGYVFGQGPSEAQAFSVEGSYLNADILIAAPQDFEVSLSEQSGYTAQLVLPQDDGIVEPSQVFVRLKEGLDVGEYEQVITVSTEGAQSLEIALSGSVIEDFFHPESHVTAFAAEATDHQSIKLTWIDASPQADAYLIKGSSIGFEDIQNPQDGIVEDNDLLVQNVAAGVENHTFNALETNTSYFFKIFPYNQSQSDILYKTDGELPQATATTLAEPQMNTELLPLYFGANNNRLPYAFRASFSGLQANTTYKYINQVVDENDGPTTNGAGVPIFVAEDGSFNRSSSTSFANPAQHGQFTTNEEGAFSGWFMIEPTTNARFAAGKTVFMRIRLNDGMDGNAVAWIFTSEAVQMLAFGTEADENMGTALRGSSTFQSGNFVFLYGADERPLAGSSVEVTGVDYAAVNAYAAFYKNDVSGVEGAWGTIVPNVNNDGIQRIEHRSNADGQLIEALVSEDGQWYQTNTVNPNGGLTEVLLIELDQSPQIAVNPQQLSGFGYVFGQGPSEAQEFSVEGSYLNADIVVAAPQDFEIALGVQSEFGTQITLKQENSFVEPIQLFVRLKEGLDVGEYEQVITVSTEGAQSLEIALNGSVIEDFFHPESHVTAFAAEATDHQSIKLTWIDASPQADAYLIKGSSIGFEDIQNPQDGIVEDNDVLVQNVAAGVENHTFNALETNTSYFFKIFPYNQSQSDILYKTDGELPQATATTLAEPQMNTELLPLYFGANNNRLPYAFRASFSGLQANTTYKYINQVVDENDGPTTNGAGVPIFVAEDGSFNRSSSTSFANPAQHGQFTTNEEGAFSGWFMIEPTTNARFAAGKTVFMRIRLNDGMDGNAVAWIFTSEAVQMLAFGTEADENMGTALRGSSSFQSGNFVFLYGADDRPLAGSSVEVTGVDYAAVNAYAAFYKNDVSGVEGAWGTIVPNVNNDGIQRIEHRNNADGQLIEALVSEDGQWYQTNTVNPNGGLTEVLLIELDQSPQIAVNPQQLSGFGYVFGQGPSEAQEFSVEGSYLNADILIAAPQDFEIALGEQSEFGAQITLKQENGFIEPIQLFVRLKAGLDVGEYEQVIGISSEGVESLELIVSGIVEEAIYSPESYPTNFVATVNSMTSISLSWTDALPAAEAYLIKASDIGFEEISLPLDGIAEMDGAFVKNIGAGVEEFTFNGLEPETTYYFSIFPYNGSAEKIKYKTDGDYPQASSKTLGEVTLTTVILPQFMQGTNGTNNTRLPYAFRATISNLLPNSTYRFINQVVSQTDGPTAGGAGNPIYATCYHFCRSTSPSLKNEGHYGEFVSDNNGEYSGWFIVEPSGNARFTPGNQVMMRLRLNDGKGGTSVVTYLTSEAVQVINFSENADEKSGTGLRAVSSSAPRNFAFIYDNTGGSGRPLYGTSIETTGIDFASITAYPAFYREEVSGQNGSWGAIVPNLNNKGIQRVEERDLATGKIVSVKTSNNGYWDNVSTTNPRGGINEILVLDLDDSIMRETVAGQLKLFNANETPVPTPNPENIFYIQLFENGIAVRPRQLISRNSLENLDAYYSFGNLDKEHSYSIRIWESNTSNSVEKGWMWNNWGGANAVDALIISYMAVGNPIAENFPWIVGEGSITDFGFDLADVNNNGQINSLDALQLMYRVIGRDDATSFPNGKHDFVISAALLDSHQELCYPQAPEVAFVTHGTYAAGSPASEVYYEAFIPQLSDGLNVFNIYLSPVGDLNASFMPQNTKQQVRHADAAIEKVVQPGDRIEIPVYISEDAELAAYNFSLNYDPNVLEILELTSTALFTHDVQNAQINIGWLGSMPEYISSAEELLMIEAVVKEVPADGNILFVNHANSSFASATAEAVNGLHIKSIKLKAKEEEAFRAQVYPNPFGERSAIYMQLPENGKLTVSILDQLGKTVITQTAFISESNKLFELDKNSLNGSGIYHYRLILEGQNKQHLLQGKIILTK